MLDNIFLQISTLLAITVSIAFIMRLLRQPLMVAYIVAGILSGPLFLNVLHGDHALYDALAQFGVVLLLFVVGLSLNVEHIKKIGKVSAIAGVAQVLFTSGIGFFLLTIMGFQFASAMYLAVGITFSSTIIIVKLLSDKKHTQSTYGRYTLGLMVIQDIIAILIMMVITTISGSDQSLAESISLFIFKSLSLLVMVYVLSRYALPKVLDKIALSGEFLFIFTVAWCFGVASILHLLGFSIEIGAIIAGLTLGSSPYQPEISSRIKPLRDFFIVLFFIILGSEMTVQNIGMAIWPAAVLAVFILLGNPFILYHTFRQFKFTRRNSLLAGLTAAQVSEFGFVLLYTGIQAGHIAGTEIEIFTIVALITIMVSSYAITYSEKIYQVSLPLFQVFGPDKYRQREEVEKKYDVFVFGYHRIGWKVCESLKEQGVSFAVVDFNPRVVSRAKHRGIDVFFGDAADVEFLESLPLDKAKLIVSTLPEVEDQLTLLKNIEKRTNKRKPKMIMNLYNSDELQRLYKAGADYVMLPHQLGGHWMADQLANNRWTKKLFKDLKQQQKDDLKLVHNLPQPAINPELLP